MNLPKDLQAYCRKRILSRVIPCILLIFVFATVLTLWGNVIFKTDNQAAQVTCYIVVMLLPFVITGVPHKLIDSTYCGTVTKVDIVTTMDSESAMKPRREQLHSRNTIYLRIEQPNGKLIYKKVYSGKAELQQNINTYNQGDLVFHLYKTNIVAILPNPNDDAVHCVVCGCSNRIENDHCHTCGHSLIKRI